jgi:hypothetical protein
MAYDEITEEIIDDGDGGDDSGSGTSSLTPDLFTIPDVADPTELKRIAENSITEGHAENASAKVGLRQPDTQPEGDGPGLNFEQQPKLADQHDGMPPNISNNPANSQHAARDFERRVENSEVSEELIYQNANQLTAEKKADLLNKATNKKTFNPQLTR